MYCFKSKEVWSCHTHTQKTPLAPCGLPLLLKTATLVYKYLHSGLPNYLGPYLSQSSCTYKTRRSQPDRHYLTILPHHSSLYKSAKQFGLSFAFDGPKQWNDLPHDVRGATSLASFRRRLKTFLKGFPTIASHTLLCLLGYDLAMSLDSWFFLYFLCLVAP